MGTQNAATSPQTQDTDHGPVQRPSHTTLLAEKHGTHDVWCNDLPCSDATNVVRHCRRARPLKPLQRSQTPLFDLCWSPAGIRRELLFGERIVETLHTRVALEIQLLGVEQVHQSRVGRPGQRNVGLAVLPKAIAPDHKVAHRLALDTVNSQAEARPYHELTASCHLFAPSLCDGACGSNPVDFNHVTGLGLQNQAVW
eukprot:721640-Prymnesium_polylepis.1